MANNSQQERSQTAQYGQRLLRLKGAATPFGPEYEFKLSGLVALRARRKGLSFQVHTNAEVAHPVDDIVLRVLEPYTATVFVQLKHATKPKNITTQAFIQDKDGRNKDGRNKDGQNKDGQNKDGQDKDGDFKLKKYFKFFADFSTKNIRRGRFTNKDEALLHDCKLKNVRLVIFTNRVARRRHVSQAQPFLNSQLEDLFSTTCKRYSVFSFGETDAKIWNLNVNKTHLYQEHFLPQLLMFCKQSSVDNLDKLIKKELEIIFGAPLPRIEQFLSGYIKFLKTWAYDETLDYPLSNSSGELETLIVDDLAEQARAAAGSTLVFRKRLCLQLKEYLSRDGTLQLKVLGVPPGYRAAKLLQVLNNDFPGCWVYVSDGTLREYPMAALEAACGYYSVQFLVVDVEEMLEPAGNLIAAVASAGRQLKVVIMSSGEETTLVSPQQIDESLEEDWRLKNLSQKAQRKVKNANVIFQGSELKLSDIQPTWCSLLDEMGGDMLSTIAKGDKLEFGAPPPKPDHSNMYVPRTLEHPSSLDPSVLWKLDARTDHLVLCGFPPKFWEEISNNTHIYSNGMNREEELCERWTVLPEDVITPRKNFNDLCKEKKDVNVHWLQYRGDGTMANLTVTWKRTEGSQAAVAPFVLLASDACTRAPTCVHATEAARDAAVWQHQAGLLVGQPGIGKTEFLKRLAAEARERAPGHWVVFVQALDHCERLRKLPEPEDLQKDHVVELLVAAAKGAAASVSNGVDAVRLCLEAALYRSGAIDVYVDGVDEVCPVFKDKLLRLIELLMLDTRVKRIWVASRPEVEILLSQTLRCQTSSLRPFSIREQKSYLCKHWSSTCNGVSKFENIAHEMVEALRVHCTEEHGNERSLLDVPLHTRMAAEAYAERATSPSSGTFVTPDISAVTQLELFDKFVKKKRTLFLDRYGLTDAKLENVLLTDGFDELHQNCAMFLMVANNGSKRNDSCPFRHYVETNRSKLPKEKNGFLWLGEDGNPQFIHKRFLDYFAATWLFKQDGNTCENETPQRNFQGQNLDSGVMTFMKDMRAKSADARGCVENSGGCVGDQRPQRDRQIRPPGATSGDGVRPHRHAVV